MKRQIFADCLRNQAEYLDILSEEIANGNEDQSEVLKHIDMDKYIQWETGRVELN